MTTPQTAWLINHRSLFLPVLEAESPSLGCQRGPGTALFWVTDFSLTVVQGAGALSSLRHSSHEVKPSWPKPHLLIPSSWGIKIPYMNFWGTQTFRLEHLPVALLFHLLVRCSLYPCSILCSYCTASPAAIPWLFRKESESVKLRRVSDSLRPRGL